MEHGVWCVVYGVWCVVCGVWCVVCGVWCVVCGAWFVRLAVNKAAPHYTTAPLRRQKFLEKQNQFNHLPVLTKKKKSLRSGE